MPIKNTGPFSAFTSTRGVHLSHARGNTEQLRAELTVRALFTYQHVLTEWARASHFFSFVLFT